MEEQREPFNKHPWADKVKIPKEPISDRRHWLDWLDKGKSYTDFKPFWVDYDKACLFSGVTYMNDEKIKEVAEEIYPIISNSLNNTFIMYAILDVKLETLRRTLGVSRDVFNNEIEKNKIDIMRISDEIRKEK